MTDPAATRATLALLAVRRSAVVSDCGRFRWILGREWDDRPRLVVCMFNPSRADADADDPTMSQISAIASHNGFGALTVVNLCPLRSSTMAPALAMLASTATADVAALERNVEVIRIALDDGRRPFLEAWGANGEAAGPWLPRIREIVRRSGAPVLRLGTCANGQPMHPLARGKHRLPKTARMIAS